MIRPVPLFLAAALLAGVWLPPWEGLIGPFPAHMLRHIVLVALAAPALVLAAPGIAARLAPPVLLAAAVEAVVVWGWHLPHLHHLAMRSAAVFVAEQALFLAVGWAVWAGALTAAVPLAGAGGLLLTSMHMTLLGAVLILAPRALYGAELAGQQAGGVLMLAIGTPAYLVGGLRLAAVSLREGTA